MDPLSDVLSLLGLRGRVPGGFDMLSAIVLSLAMMQAPRLGAADAAQITRLVAETLLPDTGMVDRRPSEGRPILFDTAQTRRAFAAAGGTIDIRSSALARAAAAMSRSNAIRCDASHRHCSVVDDGIFFAVDSVDRRGARTGEWRVVASVRWTHQFRSGETTAQGFDIALYVVRKNGRWTFVRYGSAATG